MWLSFRAAPALEPASQPAACLAPPSQALPWPATPTTWGSDWAWTPQKGLPPLTQAYLVSLPPPSQPLALCIRSIRAMRPHPQAEPDPGLHPGYNFLKRPQTTTFH